MDFSEQRSQSPCNGVILTSYNLTLGQTWQQLQWFNSSVIASLGLTASYLMIFRMGRSLGLSLVCVVSFVFNDILLIRNKS